MLSLLRRFLYEVMHPLLRRIRHREPQRISGLVRRDLHSIQPGAVRIAKEVVPRLCRQVRPRRIKAPAPILRLRRVSVLLGFGFRDLNARNCEEKG